MKLNLPRKIIITTRGRPPVLLNQVELSERKQGIESDTEKERITRQTMPD